MNDHALKVIPLLLALGLFAGACSKSSTGANPTSPPVSTSPSLSPSGSASPSACESSGATMTLNGLTANDHGTKDVSGGGKQEVEVDSCYFNPTVFTAHPGDKLTLTLGNESDTLHNFSLTEQSIDKDIQPDAETTVTVTFPASGTLVFFCKYHASQGMIGGLQVES
jgi:plastocyanin